VYAWSSCTSRTEIANAFRGIAVGRLKSLLSGQADVAALHNEWGQPRSSRMCEMVLHSVDLHVIVHLCEIRTLKE
jgi:hypothetical protein